LRRYFGHKAIIDTFFKNLTQRLAAHFDVDALKLNQVIASHARSGSRLVDNGECDGGRALAHELEMVLHHQVTD
jgi:hypothetical protein